MHTARSRKQELMLQIRSGSASFHCPQCNAQRLSACHIANSLLMHVQNSLAASPTVQGAPCSSTVWRPARQMVLLSSLRSSRQVRAG